MQKPYAVTLAAGSGQPPYQWSAPNGLPTGLRLAADGQVSGVPTVWGSYKFPVKVTDSAGASSTRTFGLGIAPATVAADPTSLWFAYAANESLPLAQTIQVSSDPPALSFTASSRDKWVRVSAGGAAPAQLSVTVDPSGLSPNTYKGTITLHAAGAVPADINISVTLQVSAAGTPASSMRVITTLAGTDWVFPQTPRKATEAPFRDMPALAVDPGSGAPCFVDSNNNLVARLNADGTTSVVAGNGIAGFSGDGGPARNASLNSPNGIAIDSQGNTYIADSWNHRIRRIDSSGVITTIAGTGTAGFSGDGGVAAGARLSSPGDLALDSAGNLYVSDTGNARIRRITPAGIISTVAGNGERGSSGDGGPALSAAADPLGIAIDANNNIYFTEWQHRIRKVTPEGIISTFGGDGIEGIGTGDGGPVAKARFRRPTRLKFDAQGNLYIADSNAYRVR